MTAAELYPEIVSSKRNEDDQPSCSAAEALTRQEPFINQNMAYQALAMLTHLLRRGSDVSGRVLQFGDRSACADVGCDTSCF